MKINKTALMIIDMQKYYLHSGSAYCRYFKSLDNSCLNYIFKRCRDVVIPNIKLLLTHFRRRKLPVIYLCLCSKKKNRSDLQHFFKEIHDQALSKNIKGVYPLVDQPMAAVVDELKPQKQEKVFYKTTFSAFTSTDINSYLAANKIKTLVFAGLATSQCVGTTARDASDRNFNIINIEDAQAD
ncbi:MAG TPA: isochorismatase family cysteine hydrolase, partial [Spirochaetota bacterium]|nr:isochorismatase family cysteine hydrolase [Spirochaetota bacterium]